VRARRLLGALALAGALTLAGAQGATASADGETQFEIYSVSGTVTLTCDPVGGTHPHAKEACAEIDAAGGDIGSVPGLPGYGCVDEWDPVLIGVTGKWRGKEVLFSSFESNRCYGAISHGHIFWY
jgi:Subtilisin inhibitor-like